MSQNEKKMFEQGPFVITTRRVVIGRDSHDLSEIETVFVLVERPWIFTGLLLLMATVTVSGSANYDYKIAAWLIAALFVAGAFLVWEYLTDCELHIHTDVERSTYSYKDISLLRRVDAQIHRAIRLHEEGDYQKLRSEIDSLPDA